ncbi:MAG: peptidoglycan bridge formation glycyltransferase FemA/FemB family protein [Pseudomonadota bacterium]
MESALKTRKNDNAPPARRRGPAVAAAPGDISVEWEGARKSEWDAFCDAANFAAFHQSFAYGDVLAEMGRPPLRARIFIPGKRLIGVAQIEIRKLLGVFTIGHLMRGPVWTADGLTAETKSAAIEVLRKTAPIKGLHGFIVSPEGGDDDGLKHAGYKRIFGGYHTVMLDLTQDEETLRTSLNGKWRNRLNASEKENLTITPIAKRIDKYGWLLEKEDERQKAARYRADPTAIVPLFQSAEGKRAIIAFEAKEGTDRVAGVLFLKHGAHATYQIGWSSAAGKDMNAHNRLLWHAIGDLKKTGVKMLDLGGVNTDFDPGIARFKIGAGGRVLTLSGSWSKGPRWR